MRRTENPAIRLMTIWLLENRRPDRTSSATCGLTARTTVSDSSALLVRRASGDVIKPPGETRGQTGIARRQPDGSAARPSH